MNPNEVVYLLGLKEIELHVVKKELAALKQTLKVTEAALTELRAEKTEPVNRIAGEVFTKLNGEC